MFSGDDNQILPSPGTKRWTPAWKAAIIEGVRGNLLTINEACKRYRLSIDEYRAWERDFDARGEPGLRSTRVGLYRKPPRVP